MAHVAFLNTLVQICIHSLEYMLVLNYLTVKMAMMNVLWETHSQISVYILVCNYLTVKWDMIHVLDVIVKPCNQNLRYTMYVVVEISASQVGHDALR